MFGRVLNTRLYFFFLDIPEPDQYWSFDQENVEDIKEIKSSIQHSSQDQVSHFRAFRLRITIAYLYNLPESLILVRVFIVCLFH